jgi:chemotaxis protein methyltransferase WspC
VSLTTIESLLRERIGLNVETVGPRLVQDAVDRRMAICLARDLTDYAERLVTDCREFDELVEEVVVLESWFFRDATPFRCLRDFVNNWRRRTDPSQPLRVLSVPCSRGEEPFSIAMTLIESGLAPGRFDVVGVDVSGTSLRRAAEGKFGPAAFRERDETSMELHQRYFSLIDGGQFQLAPKVNETVRFRRDNLISSSFLYDEQPFDVIFCRNLMIYLAAEARQMAMRNLMRLLAPAGLVYVGHTESRLVAEFGFQVWSASYVAGLTRDQRIEPVERPMSPGRSERAAGPAARRPPVSSLASSVRRDTASVSQGEAPLAAILSTARRAADAGRLEECVQLCDQMLNEHPPSADAYCLLGLVQTAQGNTTGAEQCFVRALYLDPLHRESLVHLSLLYAGRGDSQSAANYRRRAEQAARGETGQ